VIGPLRLRIGADAPSLASAQRAVAALISGAGLPAMAASRAELVVEEVALNALRHGGAPEVRLEAAIDGEGCRLRFEDDGPAFDPTAASVPARAPGEGGLGILLVRRSAARLSYARLDGGVNRLEVLIAA
jgi:anti-sigma regulatory factor (Ser/Thr protein kinase)